MKNLLALGFAVMGLGIGLALDPSPIAHADPLLRGALHVDPIAQASCTAAREDALRSIEGELLEMRRDLHERRRQLARLQTGGELPELSGLTGVCDCAPSPESGCSLAFWQAAMRASPAQLRGIGASLDRGCMQIHERFRLHPGNLPIACAAQVYGTPGDATRPGCGSVRRDILTRELQTLIVQQQRALDREPRSRRQVIDNTYRGCLEVWPPYIYVRPTLGATANDGNQKNLGAFPEAQPNDSGKGGVAGAAGAGIRNF